MADLNGLITTLVRTTDPDAPPTGFFHWYVKGAQAFIRTGTGVVALAVESESVQDIVGALIQAGPGIGVLYDDALNTLTISNTATSKQKQLYKNETPAENQTTDLASGVFINENLNFITTNLYKINISYLWSMNSGGTDLLFDVVIDGITRFSTREEPQDTGGGGPFGTDQRCPRSYSFDYTPGTTGAKNIQVRFAGSTTNDRAALYQAHIWIEEF